MAYAKIKPRRGTATQWTTSNPVLAEGEIGYEVPDAGIGKGLVNMKIGDGVTAWTSLPYAMVNKVFTATLTAGSSSVTITDDRIGSESMIDIYTDVYGVSPTEVTVNNGNIIMTFDAQETDVNVKVRVI